MLNAGEGARRRPALKVSCSSSSSVTALFLRLDQFSENICIELARNDWWGFSDWHYFSCFLMIRSREVGDLDCTYCLQLFAAWGAGYVQTNVKMDIIWALLWLLAALFEGVFCQGVYGKTNRRTIALQSCRDLARWMLDVDVHSQWCPVYCRPYSTTSQFIVPALQVHCGASVACGHNQSQIGFMYVDMAAFSVMLTYVIAVVGGMCWNIFVQA